MSAFRWLWRGLSRIGLRLLVLNSALVAAIALALLAVPFFERAFIGEAHRALDGEAEILAAAVSAKPGMSAMALWQFMRRRRSSFVFARKYHRE